MAKALKDYWITLVDDDRKDVSAGTLNTFIHIARGHHLASMMLAHGVYDQVPHDYAERGKKIADEIMMLTKNTSDYAEKKENLRGIPSGIPTVGDAEINFPSINNMNELSTLVVFKELYEQGLSPIGVLNKYMHDQLAVALYGQARSKYEGQFYAKLTDMWLKIMTGAQVIISNTDQAELNSIMRSWQADIDSRR